MDKSIVKKILNIIVPTGIGLAIAFFGVFLNKENYLSQINNTSLLSIEIIVLFIATLVWFSNYIYANLQDIQLLPEAFPNQVTPAIPLGAVFLMIGTSLAFGLLFAFAYDIILYSSIAAIFSLIDLFSDISVLRIFSKSLSGEPKATKTQQAHLKFYFHNPTLIRDVIGVFIFILPLIILSISKTQLTDELRHFFYLIFILNIFLSEWWITKWRLRRNKELIELND